MKKYHVVAEFVDSQTGERIAPAPKGEDAKTFTPHDEDQAERLIAAGCLRDPKATAKPATAEKPEKDVAKA